MIYSKSEKIAIHRFAKLFKKWTDTQLRPTSDCTINHEPYQKILVDGRLIHQGGNYFFRICKEAHLSSRGEIKNATFFLSDIAENHSAEIVSALKTIGVNKILFAKKWKLSKLNSLHFYALLFSAMKITNLILKISTEKDIPLLTYRGVRFGDLMIDDIKYFQGRSFKNDWELFKSILGAALLTNHYYHLLNTSKYDLLITNDINHMMCGLLSRIALRKKITIYITQENERFILNKKTPRLSPRLFDLQFPELECHSPHNSIPSAGNWIIQNRSPEDLFHNDIESNLWREKVKIKIEHSNKLLSVGLVLPILRECPIGNGIAYNTDYKAILEDIISIAKLRADTIFYFYLNPANKFSEESIFIERLTQQNSNIQILSSSAHINSLEFCDLIISGVPQISLYFAAHKKLVVSLQEIPNNLPNIINCNSTKLLKKVIQELRNHNFKPIENIFPIINYIDHLIDKRQTDPINDSNVSKWIIRYGKTFNLKNSYRCLSKNIIKDLKINTSNLNYQ